MKKRILCVLLVILAVLFTFASCGKNKDSNDNQNEERTTAERVPNKEVETVRPAPSIKDNQSDGSKPNGGKNNNITNPTVQNSVTDARGELDWANPVDDEALDLNKDKDISTEAMKFSYDEQGRIVLCEYTTNGMPMSVEYSYQEDGGIALFGICNGTMVIDTVYYPTRGFDPSLGFTAYNGFYFFGYDFSA